MGEPVVPSRPPGRDFMSERSDQQLMGAIAAGDVEAFAQLYDRFAPRLHGFLIRLLGPGGEVEDVLQEVFLQVWRSALEYEPARAHPAVWLFLIARSRGVDRLRRRRGLPLSAAADRPGTAPEALDRLVEQESIGRACAALAELPLEQQEALALVFWDDCTHVQVAERTQVPLGTAKTRIRLAIRRLREHLISGESERDA